MAQYTLNFIEQDFTILFLLLFKWGVVLAVFVVEFPGVLVPMVAWGIKIVCKKFEEFLTKNDIFLQKMVKWFLLYFCSIACSFSIYFCLQNG